MELFFPTYCHKCGEKQEAVFHYAGPHLKQVCLACGSYVKFFPMRLLPDKKEIGLKIMSLEPNIETIKAAKKEIGFIEGQQGADEKIQYWRLYLFFIKRQLKLKGWNYKT